MWFGADLIGSKLRPIDSKFVERMCLLCRYEGFPASNTASKLASDTGIWRMDDIHQFVTVSRNGVVVSGYNEDGIAGGAKQRKPTE